MWSSKVIHYLQCNAQEQLCKEMMHFDSIFRYDNNEIQKSIKLKPQVKSEQVCGEELLVGQDDQ